MASSKSNSKTAVIFGATSAIAQEVARVWAKRGYTLYLVARHAARLETVALDLEVRGSTHVFREVLDLDDVASHSALEKRIGLALGASPDILLLAQGALGSQERANQDPAHALALMHTNFTAPVSLLQIFARSFEARGSGVIAAIGSVAGDRGRQSNYVYGSAKGGLALFLSGLRNRLFASGVHVLTIKPGFVDTPMTAAIPKSGPLWASAERVGAGIVHAIDARKDLVYLPGFWRLILWIICSIPERLFKRLKL